METNFRYAQKLYRYSEARWLERSLRLGEFRLRPAEDYRTLEGDSARQDNELVRIRESKPENVKITLPRTGQEFTPIGPVTYTSTFSTNYLTLCLSSVWNENHFKDFTGTDACLIIHNPEEFAERLHEAAEAILPGWCGIDAPITYIGKSRYGVPFSKPLRFFAQQEWRFSWVPPE